MGKGNLPSITLVLLKVCKQTAMNLLCCSQGPVSAACRVSAVREGIPQCWRVPSFGVFPEHHSYGASTCLPKSKCSEEEGNGKAQSLQEAGL